MNLYVLPNNSDCEEHRELGGRRRLLLNVVGGDGSHDAADAAGLLHEDRVGNLRRRAGAAVTHVRQRSPAKHAVTATMIWLV